MERVLLYQNFFKLILNPDWFIDYIGILTLSIPEATPGYYSDPVGKIVLSSTTRCPSSQRIILLYNCADVRIRYNASDAEYFETSITFVDMKSNTTFTIKHNLDEAKRLCNSDILVAISEIISTTKPPQTSTKSNASIQPFLNVIVLFSSMLFSSFAH